MLLVVTILFAVSAQAREPRDPAVPGGPEASGPGIAPARITASLAPAPPRQTSSGGTLHLTGSLRKAAPIDAIFSDGFETATVEMWDLAVPDPGALPSGAVVFMDSTDCPAGWSELVPGLGRAVLGVPAGGTVGGSRGTGTGTLGATLHSHHMGDTSQTQSAGSHNHWWSIFWWNEKKWSTYTENYGVIYPVDWGNGIGSEGSGIYPLAAYQDATFCTDYVTGHAHSVSLNHQTEWLSHTLPYLYLKACQKD